MSSGELIGRLDGVSGGPAPRADLEYQGRILQDVSRTFALTIPQLPAPLSGVVANAYLLCRIADTIEDAAELEGATKQAFAARFAELVRSGTGAEAFAKELSAQLDARTPAAERDLVANTARVVRITHGCEPVSRDALARCVAIMSRGMAEFQAEPSLGGLDDTVALDRYCYYVAGVVGEMLTELFCAHVPALAPERERMLALAVRFGQGLQMTNILKDVWEDRRRGACWLPASVFRAHGVELAALAPEGHGGRVAPGHAAAMVDLLGIATGHLRAALEYTLTLPAREPGMRRFCLWALGMALLTLRKIAAHPDFERGQDVKITRNAVRATIAFCAVAGRGDRVLRLAFERLARSLPPVPASYVPARVSEWRQA